MFGLFKKTVQASGVLSGFVDAHSHSLWGVDDGAQTQEETRQMLLCYKELGAACVWATPHIMAQVHRNKEEDFRAHFAQRIAPLAAELELCVELAAEYMMDAYLLDKLKAGHELLCYPRRHVLVEMPMTAPVMDRDHYFYEIDSQGYCPVLAHAERYLYLEEGELHELKDGGALFQLNLLSLSEFYGQRVQQRALMLLNEGMYDLVGSDAHGAKMLRKVAQMKLPKKTLRQLAALVERNQDFFTL